MAYVLTINAVTKTIQPGWVISAPTNGVGNMRCSVVSADGSYVPDLDQEIILTDSSVRIFGGFVNNMLERGLGNIGATPITSEVSAIDFNSIATHYVAGGGFAAGTLKAALLILVAQMTGVTLDAGQVTGPTLPAVDYTGWKFNDILDQLGTYSGGYIWEIDYNKVLRMYLPGAHAAPFNVAAGDGNTIGDVKVEWARQNYANRVIVWGTGFTAIVSDAPAIAAHGQWDLGIRAPDSKTQAEVDALAAAILAASLPIVKRVTYVTYRTGIFPGMTQTINLPLRHVNNTFLVTNVDIRNVGNLVQRTIQTIEGLVYQTGWREKIRSLGGAGGFTSPGLGGGGVVAMRFAYFLGGTGIDFVQSATPTWVPASPIQVQINTVPRGTTAALINGRLRALNSGVSVQARLYDLTAAAACPGTSAVITSTSWQTISFVATLTAGSHLYELQLLPGTANEDVGAVAYLE